MNKYSAAICDSLKRNMETNKEQFEKHKREAVERERRAIPLIMRNNEMVKQVQREIAQLGANTLIRNRGIKLLTGISFLEELDILDTPSEKGSQIRILMSRLAAVHRDALDAAAVVEESMKAAEFERLNYEDKKRKFEEKCGHN